MTLRQWLRKHFVSSPFATPVDLSGRTIIVTGASPGSLGYENARTLAGWGANIWRTNYLGTVQLTDRLLPLLKKTGPDSLQ